MSKLALAAALLCAGGKVDGDFSIHRFSIVAEVTCESRLIEFSDATVYASWGKAGLMGGVRFQYITSHRGRTLSLHCDTDGINIERGYPFPP